MAEAQSTSLYGIVGQPLTQDYLARQLPIFQQKVPNVQVKQLASRLHAQCSYLTQSHVSPLTQYAVAASLLIEPASVFQIMHIFLCFKKNKTAKSPVLLRGGL